MLMPRDKLMLIHIEKYGAATINQMYKLYFNSSVYGHDCARKRLKYLVDSNMLKFYMNRLTNERVFYIDKQLSSHDLLLMDVYCTLIAHGAEILEFKKEPQYMNGKIRPDGFFKFKFADKTRILFVEIDLAHKADLSRYDRLFDTGELQEKYKAFPPVLSVTEFPDRHRSDKVIIKYVDYKLNQLPQKILLGAY